MTNLKKKITELPIGTPVDTDIIPFVNLQGIPVTQKATRADLKGEKGDTGDAATADAGTTTTGAEGTNASVVNVGTVNEAIFNFIIPRGDTGGKGDTGENGKTILNGVIDPTTEGVDGDFYINTISWQIFGPKVTTWGTGTDLIGANGTDGRSIVSIDLTSGTHLPGMIDTYTITYDKAPLTSTFQIYNGANGENAPETEIEYSIDGSTLWHTPFVIGDKYIRFSTDGGSTWSDGQKYVGEDGAGNVSSDLVISDNSIVRGDGGAKGVQESKVSIDDNGNIIPDTDKLQELGSQTKTLKNIYVTDENNIVFTARHLAKLHRDYAEGASLNIYEVTYAIVGGVWTITITDNSGLGYLAFAIGGTVIRSTGTTLSVNATAFAGTDSLPNTVYVYVENNGSDIPILVASNTNPDPIKEHSHVANYKVGTVGATTINIYGKLEAEVEMYKIASNVFHRFYQEGPVYNTGLLPTITSSDVTIGVGQYEVIFKDITSSQKQVSVDGLYFIKNDGTYEEATDFNFGGEYSDGVTIDGGKRFNVVLGIMEDDVTRIFALVQTGIVEQYGDFNKAYEDKKNQTIYQPNDQLLKNIFVPVARIIVNKQTVSYLEQFDDGKYYQDLRGTRGLAGGGTPGSSNVVDGNILNDFATWNSINGQYEPKTITETKAILSLVSGPTSATDTAIAIFDGPTGKLLKNSLATIEPAGDITTPARLKSSYNNFTAGLFGGGISFYGVTYRGFWDGTNPLIRFPSFIANAINNIKVSNSITGNGPIIEVEGADTNIDLNLNAKGTGVVKANGNELAKESEVVKSIAGTPTGGDKVTNIISLTQAEYDTATKVSTFFYIITDA